MLDIALGTFATYNPQSISPSTSIFDALATMNRLGIHHLPVVDKGQNLIGIVSHRDLSTRRQPSSLSGPALRVENVMVRGVYAVDISSPPSVPLRAILDHNFHCVPVMKNGQLRGMVTSTDYLRELSYGQWPVCNERVDDHMVTIPAGDDLVFSAVSEVEGLIEESSVVYGEQALGTAAGIMVEYGVTEIAVLDPVSNPIGILRVDDILQVIASVLE